MSGLQSVSTIVVGVCVRERFWKCWSPTDTSSPHGPSRSHKNIPQHQISSHCFSQAKL